MGKQTPEQAQTDAIMNLVVPKIQKADKDYIDLKMKEIADSLDQRAARIEQQQVEMSQKSEETIWDKMIGELGRLAKLPEATVKTLQSLDDRLLNIDKKTEDHEKRMERVDTNKTVTMEHKEIAHDKAKFAATLSTMTLFLGIAIGVIGTLYLLFKIGLLCL